MLSRQNLQPGMSFPNYGLPPILDRKHLCFKYPKYANAKLINFIINNLSRRLTFWQFKTNFTVIINFTMIYTQWTDRSDSPPFKFDFSCLASPFSKFCSFRNENLRILQSLNQSKSCSHTPDNALKPNWTGIVIKDGLRH